MTWTSVERYAVSRAGLKKAAPAQVWVTPQLLARLRACLHVLGNNAPAVDAVELRDGDLVWRARGGGLGVVVRWLGGPDGNVVTHESKALGWELLDRHARAEPEAPRTKMDDLLWDPALEAVRRAIGSAHYVESSVPLLAQWYARTDDARALAAVLGALDAPAAVNAALSTAGQIMDACAALAAPLPGDLLERHGAALGRGPDAAARREIARSVISDLLWALGRQPALALGGPAVARVWRSRAPWLNLAPRLAAYLGLDADMDLFDEV